MAKVVAKQPSLQVAKPIAATLYIVLDPAKVKQAYHVSSARRKLSLDISEFDLFVSRDLKNAMAPNFEHVEVVAPGAAFTAKYVVADVKVDNVEMKDEAIEGAVSVISTRLVLTWAFAVRPAEADDYLFSFAGSAASTDTANGPEDFVRQVVESAISGLLQKWGEGDVHSKLLEWSHNGNAPSAG